MDMYGGRARRRKSVLSLSPAAFPEEDADVARGKAVVQVAGGARDAGEWDYFAWNAAPPDPPLADDDADDRPPAAPPAPPESVEAFHHVRLERLQRTYAEEQRRHGEARPEGACGGASAPVQMSLSSGAPRNEPANGDITAEQAACGVDVQGIPWEDLPFSREDYRAKRLRDNHGRDAADVGDGLHAVVKEPRRGGRFYQFFRNTRRVKCSIVHFQLRNLAWATSKHDVFVMHDAAVVHWDAAARRKSQVLDLSGSSSGAATGLGMVQISTMIAKDDIAIAGGFYGEMVAKNLSTGVIVHNKRITYDENAITNAIDIFGDKIMTSNNDCFVRCFDMPTFQRTAAFHFTTPVNHATRQPEGKMVAVVGDDKVVQVMDGDTGQSIAKLHGHEDYSFATSWHPGARMFATGSQDNTCRVWDVRNMSQSVCVLGTRVGAVRSLRFSACGRFLAMAEPRDFVHIYGVNRGEFDTCQEIDLFGEIAGIALTPSAEALYIAVSDRAYSSLLEYERTSNKLVSEPVL